MPLLGGISRDNPAVADAMNKKRFMVRFNSEIHESGVGEDLIQTRIIPIRDYWWSFTADCHCPKVASERFRLGPTNEMLVDEIETDKVRHVGETDTRVTVWERNR